ncbi:MAG: family 16 glycoside hydrolase, partial [Actinomycetota bacterium]
MMTRLLLLTTITLLISSCGSGPKENWIQLFNGKDLDGWVIKIKGSPLGENYRNTFRVEEGIMKVSYSEYDTFRYEFGHIYFRQPFSSYKLRV